MVTSPSPTLARNTSPKGLDGHFTVRLRAICRLESPMAVTLGVRGQQLTWKILTRLHSTAVTSSMSL
uniref:Uncharacterized protein n=1 Tax=uncultured marine group II/III euryarchaeote KM3_31_G10 TaxID=1456433 RepID=A0A075H424_9EURY|nr:hypothetical protein [uncultured marine group II/III euryarchaeote KM3_31_G10]